MPPLYVIVVLRSYSIERSVILPGRERMLKSNRLQHQASLYLMDTRYGAHFDCCASIQCYLFECRSVGLTQC